MKKPILLFDVDGTLVDSTTHIVPASTKLALQQLKQLGYLLGISTGRSIYSLLDGQFDKLIDWDVYLCNNGQAIYDHNKKILHMECIEKESVQACIKVAEERNTPIFIMGETQRLTSKPNEDVYTSLDFFKELLPPIQPYDDSDVIMMIAYGSLGYDYHEYKQIKGIDVIPGQSTYADVVKKGFHKHKGIEFVLEHFKYNEYIAFGDSLNDMEMIEHALHGVAMGNAHDDLKAIADFITDDVSHDGIMNALKKLSIL